jgi:hypothetical protein
MNFQTTVEKMGFGLCPTPPVGQTAGSLFVQYTEVILVLNPQFRYGANEARKFRGLPPGEGGRAPSPRAPLPLSGCSLGLPLPHGGEGDIRRAPLRMKIGNPG